MSTSTSLDSYSLRILSPFSGTARVIQQQHVRALSNDGVNWRIQLQAPDTGEALNRYTLFGLWARHEGLREFPVHLQQTSKLNIEQAHNFVQQLPDWLNQLSFPLRDNMECWLLDKENQPLALLLACQANKPLPIIRRPTWLPCAMADHTFVSAHLPEHKSEHGHSNTLIYHRDVVAQLVHQTTGQNRNIQWFHRQADGSGIGQAVHTHNKLAMRQLPAEVFPRYLLRQSWHNQLEQQLMDDFFHWQSPWLLSLPDLTENERLQLEIQACDYPRRLHALYHLYPNLLQQELIYKTLIQAKIEKTTPSQDI